MSQILIYNSSLPDSSTKRFQKMTTVLHTMGDNAAFFFLLKEIQVDTARRIQFLKLPESSPGIPWSWFRWAENWSDWGRYSRDFDLAWLKMYERAYSFQNEISLSGFTGKIESRQHLLLTTITPASPQLRKFTAQSHCRYDVLGNVPTYSALGERQQRAHM